MKIDLKKFQGTLPYASELFGVYQPLLGWRSKLTVDRMTRDRSSAYKSFTERAIARVETSLSVTTQDNGAFDVMNIAVPQVGGSRTVLRVPPEIESVLAWMIAEKLQANAPPTVARWRELLDRDKALSPMLIAIRDLALSVNTPNPAYATLSEPIRNYLNDNLRPDSQVVPLRERLETLLQREARIAGYLSWLAGNKPDALNELFFRAVVDPFQDLIQFQDPLAMLGSNDLSAVLSPIGIVHLYREYFFDFDSFLGPSVGHVWLPPGTTLELVEESTRKTTAERTQETDTESKDKRESEEKDRDELSTAVKEEQRTNTKFGFSANISYKVAGTFETGANSNLSFETSRTSARDTAHKQLREQTEKVASEIRQRYRSTFKTTTETTDKSTRRYIVENKTKRVINYELRRKMRQVGVQVQDIGTQLCWQVFVDNPGATLGVGQLVHIAAPPDLGNLAPPPAPAQLERKKVAPSEIQFDYEVAADSDGSGEGDVVYYDGNDEEYHGGGGRGGLGTNDRIVYRRTYPVCPPIAGYKLAGAVGDRYRVLSEHSDRLIADAVKASDDTIEIILHQVNFANQPSVKLQVETVWDPPPDQQAALDRAYAQALTDYDLAVGQRQKEAFMTAARERIKLASQIRSRPFDDMRDEERTVVYRSLIATLASVGERERQDRHVTSELIRAIFDVDKMLYFVAPEWWAPQARPVHSTPQQLGAADGAPPFTPASVVSWGGYKEEGRKDNYYITEESAPARLGASLGWLLQLDGDNLRNAFLNSPWVKAIIPIRPGKEEAALNWLRLAHVAGADGLEARYDASPDELKAIRESLAALGRPVVGEVTIDHALIHLANEVKRNYVVATTAQPSPFDPSRNVIPTETVFEHGFNPLQGGFEVNTDPNRVFSEWREVLPTDQVVAVDYTVPSR